MRLQIFLVAALLVTCSACSKKKEVVEPRYTVEELTALAHGATATSEKGEEAIQFSDYAPGVNKVESKSFRYERLVFYAIKFETTEEARSEAVRLNQYYARNWLFDRVEGEPILEDYVITTFQAANPNRQIQRKPKAAHSEKSGHHSEAAPAHH